jgi:hypothetical protein
MSNGTNSPSMVQHQHHIESMLGFGNVIFVQKVVAVLKTLPFICVNIQRKFLLNAVFARKNTLANTP